MRTATTKSSESFNCAKLLLFFFVDIIIVIISTLDFALREELTRIGLFVIASTLKGKNGNRNNKIRFVSKLICVADFSSITRKNINRQVNEKPNQNSHRFPLNFLQHLKHCRFCSLVILLMNFSEN